MHAECMGMAQLDQIIRRAASKRDNAIHFEITENAVMGISGILVITKQPEIDKHIAPPHTLPLKMGLRRSALPKQALTIVCEHRIMVAKIIPAHLAATGHRRLLR